MEEDQLKELLPKMDVWKFMDFHKIHQQVQKKLASVFVGPLLIIFERSWRLGLILENWKKANYTSLFKKDKEEDRGNCRTVSISSTVGKQWHK